MGPERVESPSLQGPVPGEDGGTGPSAVALCGPCTPAVPAGGCSRLGTRPLGEVASGGFGRHASLGGWKLKKFGGPLRKNSKLGIQKH